MVTRFNEDLRGFPGFKPATLDLLTGKFLPNESCGSGNSVFCVESEKKIHVIAGDITV